MAEKTEIPAFIRIANDQQMLEMGSGRKYSKIKLKAIEVAISYKRLMTECKLTQEHMLKELEKEKHCVKFFKTPETPRRNTVC